MLMSYELLKGFWCLFYLKTVHCKKNYFPTCTNYHKGGLRDLSADFIKTQSFDHLTAVSGVGTSSTWARETSQILLTCALCFFLGFSLFYILISPSHIS